MRSFSGGGGLGEDKNRRRRATLIVMVLSTSSKLALNFKKTILCSAVFVDTDRLCRKASVHIPVSRGDHLLDLSILGFGQSDCIDIGSSYTSRTCQAEQGTARLHSAVSGQKSAVLGWVPG